MAETTEMGRVTTPARIENLEDLYRSERGEIPADQVRSIVVADALVDTGATRLALPERLVNQLGLRVRREATTMTAGGERTVRLFGAVKLTVMGRDCIIDVTELPDECPVLIGQVPLELMDWVIDMRSQKLTGNPRHGGQWMQELY
ncbi:MAG: aspartyl protease family protein [Lacipirellulaceae bacterium]